MKRTPWIRHHGLSLCSNMSVTTTASTFKFVRYRGSKISPFKPISFLQFPSSNLAFSAGLVSKRAVRQSMTEFVKTSAFGSNSGDDGVGAFEQEALINESSGVAAHGLESTLNSLSKWLVAGLFAALLLWRHDAEALWAASGSVINSVLSMTLKRVLNQERPVSTLRSDPGMPSSHAQSISFTVFFVIISILEWQGVNGITLSVSGLPLAIGSYLCWLRVSQQFHTISQVVVGATLGSIFSIFWFWLWNAIFLKLFISSLWVRIIVVSGTAGFCLGFIFYVIRHWLKDER